RQPPFDRTSWKRMSPVLLLAGPTVDRRRISSRVAGPTLVKRWSSGALAASPNRRNVKSGWPDAKWRLMTLRSDLGLPTPPPPASAGRRPGRDRPGRGVGSVRPDLERQARENRRPCHLRRDFLLAMVVGHGGDPC